MRIELEYNQATGQLMDSKGMTVSMIGLIGFKSSSSTTTLDLIKQGITPDELIKLKNNDLL